MYCADRLRDEATGDSAHVVVEAIALELWRHKRRVAPLAPVFQYALRQQSHRLFGPQEMRIYAEVL